MSGTETREKADIEIMVRRSTWSRLNVRKTPGQTFDALINSLLDATEAKS